MTSGQKKKKETRAKRTSDPRVILLRRPRSRGIVSYQRIDYPRSPPLCNFAGYRLIRVNTDFNHLEICNENFLIIREHTERPVAEDSVERFQKETL